MAETGALREARRHTTGIVVVKSGQLMNAKETDK